MAPPVSARCRHYLASSSPSRSPPLATGPRCGPVLPVSCSRRINRAPLPSPVAPQRHRSPPMAGGRYRLLHAVGRCAGPLSAPSPAPTRHRPDPPPFPSSPHALSAFKSRRPPTSLPFFFIFFSIRSARRCLPAPPPSLSAPFPSPHRLTTRRPSHLRR
jgi:hypothetical protein